MKPFSILVILSLMFAPAVQANDITFKSTELSKGLYVLQGVGGFAGGNIALSVGEDGVVMIDDSMPPLLDNLKKTIAEITDAPVNFLINTHVHGDHTGNNVAMAGKHTHIVAHHKLRERLKESEIDGPEGKMPMPVEGLPVLTFSEEITFHLNGEEARVFHLQNAHTDGDAVIHFKKANIIHTGDILFNGLFPYIDLGKGGTLAGYIAAQKKIYQLADDDTRIIPGHGPLATRADLKAEYEMLEEASKLVKKLKKKGLSEDQVVDKNPLEKFHDDWNWGFITTEKMTRTIYQSVE